MSALRIMPAIMLAALALLARAEITLSVPAPRSPAAATRPDAGAAEDGEDVLQLAGGNRLHGRLLRLEPAEHGLQWQHRLVRAPISFAASGVERIELGGRGAGQSAQAAAVIGLNNGDELSGAIVALDGKNLVLDTPYAGRLRIARNLLRSIAPPPVPVYAGPGGLAEWSFNQPTNQPAAWEFRDGRLLARSNVPIGRHLDVMGALPDRLEIRFDAIWKGLPAFAFIFYAADLQKSDQCYRLEIKGPRLLLQRLAGQPATVGAPADYQPFAVPDLKRRADFQLRTDRTNLAIRLLINGQPAGAWTDRAGFLGGGKGLVFLPEKDSALEISNLRVSEWDTGQPPKTVEPERREDLVHFVNLDALSGTLLGIEGGNLRFQNAGTVFDVPLVRVREILLAAGEGARAGLHPDDVRGVFRERGALTFRPLKIEQDRIRAASDNFGQATLPLGAFTRLEFNIHRPPEP